MGLSEVATMILDRLGQLPGIDNITDAPPPQLADDRTLIIYTDPGDQVPIQHTGRNGQPVVSATDTILVEYHRKAAQDTFGLIERETRPVLDLVRGHVWAMMLRPELRAQLIAITSVRTLYWGEFRIGTDTTFGFRLGIEVEHATELDTA